MAESRRSDKLYEISLDPEEVRKTANSIVLTQEMVVGFTFIFECQPAVRDMVKILQPFEERHGHTTGVDVQVRDDQNVAFQKDFVSGWCGRSIGSFSNDLFRE